MSDSNDVKVTISSDTSNYTSGMKTASDAAQGLSVSLGKVGSAMPQATMSAADFNAALAGVGNNISKITPEMLGLGSSTGALATALFNATASARGAAVVFGAFSTAGLGMETAFKSAAESAEIFLKALNPTPLQALRTLMGDEIPPAFRMTQVATQACIGSLQGLDAGFKSAEDSALVFQRALNPTPLQQLRTAMDATATGSGVLVTTIGQAITAGTGLGASFKSAADSMAAFMAVINPTPVQAFRAAMAEELPAGIKVSQTSIEACIEAATGLGSAFKSAEESASVFSRALDPTPLQNLRDLMGNALPDALTHTSATINQLIEAATGQDRAIKSAAESADVFSRALGLTLTPIQKLRDMMSDELPAGLRIVETDINALIAAITNENNAFKSAADSAQVFASALGLVETPLQRLRGLMGTDIPQAGSLTVRTLRDNIDAANGISREFKSAADSAQIFNQALDPTPLQQMRKLMADDVPPAAHSAASGVAGITREFFVLGHEAMNGRFNMIPGSLLTLAERCGGVMTALGQMAQSFTEMQWAGVGALAAVGVAFVKMAVDAHNATIAINEATAAATMQGRSPAQAREDMEAYGASMQKVGVMSDTAMAQVSSAISSLSSVTRAQKSEIAQFGSELFLNWDSDSKKTAEQISQIFATPDSLKKFAEDNHLLSIQQINDWAATKDASKQYEIGIQALTSAMVPLNDQIKKRQEAMEMAQAAGMTGQPMQGSPDVLSKPVLGDFDRGTSAPDPSQVADNQAVIDGNKHLQEKADLQAQLAHEQSALATALQANDQTAQAAARSAIEATTAQIVSWKAVGDATLAARQQVELNAQIEARAAQGGDRRQLAEDEKNIRIAFWDQEVAKSAGDETAITREKANAQKARIGLYEQESAVAGTYQQEIARQATAAGETALVAADKAGKGRTAMTEAQVAAEYQVYLKASQDMTRTDIAAARDRLDFATRASQLHGQLLKDDASAEAAANKQSLANYIATQHEKENAAGMTSAAAIALQTQLVAKLQAMGTAEVAKAEAEQSRLVTMKRDADDKALAAHEQAMAKQRQTDSSAIGAMRALLDEEVAEQKMSKAQEMTALTAFAAQKHAAELKSLADTLATLDKEKAAHAALYAEINVGNNAGLSDLQANLTQQSAAYQKLYNEIAALKMGWLTEDMRMNRTATEDLKKQWQAGVAPISSAIDSQIGAVLRGNETMGQATQKMLGDIVIGYAQMGVKKLMQLAADKAMEIALGTQTEAEKTALQQGGAATRGAISTAETATQNAGVLGRLATWLFGETAKTTATATNATAQTGAVVAAQTTQTAVTTAARAEGSAQEVAMGSATVMNAAYKAAANTYASVSAIPYVGWVLAPAAAAGAFAAVAAFDTITGLETGTYNVPQNMLANLHAGEMVVPETFASGIRGAMGQRGGGGGDTTQNLTYAPHVSASGADLGGVMRQQAASMKSYMWHATRNGALAVPGRG